MRLIGRAGSLLLIALIGSLLWGVRSLDYTVELEGLSRLEDAPGLRLEGLALRYQGLPILRAKAIDFSLEPTHTGLDIEFLAPSLFFTRTEEGLLRFGGVPLGGQGGGLKLLRWIHQLQLESGQLTLTPDAGSATERLFFGGMTGSLLFLGGEPVEGSLTIKDEEASGLSLAIQPAAEDGTRRVRLALMQLHPALLSPLIPAQADTLEGIHSISGTLSATVPTLGQDKDPLILRSLMIEDLALRRSADAPLFILRQARFEEVTLDRVLQTLTLRGLEVNGLSHDVTQLEKATCNTVTYAPHALGLRMDDLNIHQLTHRTLHLEALKIPLIEGTDPKKNLDISEAVLEGLHGRLFDAGVLALKKTHLLPEEGRFLMTAASAEAVKGEFLELRQAEASAIDYDYRNNQLRFGQLLARRAVADQFKGDRIEAEDLVWQPEIDHLHLHRTRLDGARLEQTRVHHVEILEADIDLEALKIKLEEASLEKLLAPAMKTSTHRIPTRIKALGIKGLDLDIPERRWRAEEIHLGAPSLRVDDDPATRKGLAVHEFGHSNPANPKGADWRYAISKLKVDQGRLTLRLKHQAGARWAFKHITLSADDLDPQARDAIDLELGLRMGPRGRLRLTGRIRQDSLGGLLNLDLEDVRLRPFRSLLPVSEALTIEKGRLSLSGQLRVDLLNGRQFEFKGDAKATHLRATAPRTERTLLAFETLILDDLEFSLQPRVFSVRIVDLVKAYVHAEIDDHHHLNLATLWDHPSPPLPSTARPPLIGSIGLLRILGSRLDYTDRVFDPDLMVTVRKLEGTVRGISTRETARAQISLEGLINRETPLRIFGWVNPVRPRDDTDLKLEFQGLDLTSFDQFAGQFAGYKVERGKLSLDLRYTLKDRQLSVEDNLMLNRLTLGESTTSEHRWLVDLALWLLEDGKGNLDLDLPVSGDLEDPSFSLSALYLSALEHLPYRVLNTPVGLIGSLVPVDERNAEVAFAAGQRTPLDPETRSLLSLVEGFREDDTAILEIEPSADPNLDGPALTATAQKDRKSVPQLSKEALGSGQETSSLKRSLPNAPVDVDDLSNLAFDRADAIRQALITHYGLPSERIFQKPLVLKPHEEAIRLNVHLGIR